MAGGRKKFWELTWFHGYCNSEGLRAEDADKEEHRSEGDFEG